MNKRFQSVFVMVFCILLSGLVFASCENSTEIICASLSETTAAGSENYGVRITFSQDRRVEEKYLDVQIMSDRELPELVFWKENNNKKTIKLDKKDYWYSLTTLSLDEDKQGTEDFEMLGQALSKNFLFNCKQQATLKFRVVAGDAQDNQTNTGKVLTSISPISKEFKLKIEKTI